jgi:hypothetical protein
LADGKRTYVIGRGVQIEAEEAIRENVQDLDQPHEDSIEGWSILVHLDRSQ